MLYIFCISKLVALGPKPNILIGEKFFCDWPKRISNCTRTRTLTLMDNFVCCKNQVGELPLLSLLQDASKSLHDNKPMCKLWIPTTVFSVIENKCAAEHKFCQGEKFCQREQLKPRHLVF